MRVGKGMMKRNGDCIVIACRNVIENSEWLFCYANVKGQGTLVGLRILHAWNEVGDVVVDFSNGNRIVLRKERYYELAEISEKDIIRQSLSIVAKLMLETKTYGGWIKKDSVLRIKN